MFHLVALPAHVFFFGYLASKGGKQSANLRLAKWPVWAFLATASLSSMKCLANIQDNCCLICAIDKKCLIADDRVFDLKCLVYVQLNIVIEEVYTRKQLISIDY